MCSGDKHDGKQTDLNVSVLVDNVHPPIHALFVAELLPEYEISVCILYSFYLSDITLVALVIFVSPTPYCIA